MEKGNALHLFKSLQPNKKGIHHLVQLRNASVIDVSKTKLDETYLKSDVVIKDFDLIKLDWFRKKCVFAYFINNSAAYTYKAKIFLNAETIIIKVYLPKTEPFIAGIIYRPPDKVDFVNCLDQIISQFNTLETLGNFNINWFFNGDEAFSNNIAKAAYKEMPPLTKKKYLDFCFSYI